MPSRAGRGSATALGASSRTFWCRRCSEHSRSPRNTPPPRPSPNTWISRCRGAPGSAPRTPCRRGRRPRPPAARRTASGRSAGAPPPACPGRRRRRWPSPGRARGCPGRPGAPSQRPGGSAASSRESRASSTGTPQARPGPWRPPCAPRARMLGGLGPTKTMPASSTAGRTRRARRGSRSRGAAGGAPGRGRPRRSRGVQEALHRQHRVGFPPHPGVLVLGAWRPPPPVAHGPAGRAGSGGRSRPGWR